MIINKPSRSFSHNGKGRVLECDENQLINASILWSNGFGKLKIYIKNSELKYLFLLYI